MDLRNFFNQLAYQKIRWVSWLKMEAEAVR